MPFSGNENHDITLANAAALTARYRTNHSPNPTLGFFYGKQAILDILNQPGCVGLRIYYGEDAALVPNFVITGTDANENDLFNGNLAEGGIKSPPNNSTPNPLNS